MLLAATSSTTSESVWQTALGWIVSNGLVLLSIVAGAALVWWILLRLITRLTENAKKNRRVERLGQVRSAAHTAELTDVLMTQRREQRAEAMGQLLKSVATFTVWTIAAFMIMAQLGVNLGPLIASAGIIGVALGFGAQTMVKDFLSGIFLVLEDQFGVGDVVDLGPAIGTVEEVTLRVTRVRDLSGIVWYVRNGEILRVGNRSQGWTMAMVDIPVGYDEDLDKVRRIVDQVGDAMDDDPSYDGILFGTPTYAGVESVSGDAVFIRVTAKAAPDQQMTAARAIREKLKTAFDTAGIRVPVLARPAGAMPPGQQQPGTGPRT